MVTLRSHGAKRVAPPEEAAENILSQLPAEKDREFDIELGLLTLNGLLITSPYLPFPFFFLAILLSIIALWSTALIVSASTFIFWNIASITALLLRCLAARSQPKRPSI